MSDQPKPLPANAVHSMPSYTPDQLRAWLELSRMPGVHTASPDDISTTEEASKDPRVQELIRMAAGVTGAVGQEVKA
jgi:hypothetical protein